MNTENFNFISGEFHSITTIKVLKSFFWDRKLYYVYKNQLVACKVVRLKFNLAINMTELVLKLAKYGEISVNLQHTHRFYLSVEDFEKKMCLETSSDKFINYYKPFDAIFEAFCEREFGEICRSGNYYKLYQYKWDGVQAVRVLGKVPKIMYYNDEQGFYFEDEIYSSDIYKDLYPTKADCELCNEISVVDFDDEEKDNEDNTNYNLVIFGVLNSKISKNELEKIKEILK